VAQEARVGWKFRVSSVKQIASTDGLTVMVSPQVSGCAISNEPGVADAKPSHSRSHVVGVQVAVGTTPAETVEIIFEMRRRIARLADGWGPITDKAMKAMKR
jgi:hypothetical protein